LIDRSFRVPRAAGTLSPPFYHYNRYAWGSLAENNIFREKGKDKVLAAQPQAGSVTQRIKN
jgi:hypothetical protein